MFDFTIKGLNVEIHWIEALINFLVLYGLVVLFSFLRVKNTLKAFSQGNCDEKLIKKCKSIKRQYYSRKDKKVYNLFCTVLAAIALQTKQSDLFFENFNDYKNIDIDSQNRLFILVLSYIKGQSYSDLFNECKTLSENQQFGKEQICFLYKKYGVKSETVVELLNNENFNLHNQEVIECLNLVINIL